MALELQAQDSRRRSTVVRMIMDMSMVLLSKTNMKVRELTKIMTETNMTMKPVIKARGGNRRRQLGLIRQPPSSPIIRDMIDNEDEGAIATGVTLLLTIPAFTKVQIVTSRTKLTRITIQMTQLTTLTRALTAMSQDRDIKILPLIEVGLTFKGTIRPLHKAC